MPRSLRPLDPLQDLDEVRLHPGAEPSLFARLRADHEIVLPESHQAVLRQSNGVETYGGYFRLFGIYANGAIDSVAWNGRDCWKFAWGDRCAGYWCFGETAWGDQYAYELESLRAGGEAKVHLLDAFSMSPQETASSFAGFLENEFIPFAKAPYDSMIKQARRKLGPLAATSHLAYVPSLLLGAGEFVENVQAVNARAAMICNGDIALQLDARPRNGGSVRALEPYEDERKRMRMRVVWA